MAIKIERGPSMIDYGQAVAQASERTYAAERQKDYANYLAGIQKANQDYKLGASKLGIEGPRSSRNSMCSATVSSTGTSLLKQKNFA